MKRMAVQCASVLSLAKEATQTHQCEVYADVGDAARRCNILSVFFERFCPVAGGVWNNPPVLLASRTVSLSEPN